MSGDKPNYEDLERMVSNGMKYRDELLLQIEQYKNKINELTASNDKLQIDNENANFNLNKYQEDTAAILKTKDEKIAKLEDDILSATKTFLNENGKSRKMLRELTNEVQTLKTRMGIVKREAGSMAAKGSTPKDRTYFKHIYNLCNKSLR